MTSIITDATTTAIESSSYAAFSTSVGAIAIVLLIVLLVQKELLRAIGGPDAVRWVRALNTAIVPLLLVFGTIVLARLVDLIQPR